jgi:hypothetical protein
VQARGAQIGGHESAPAERLSDLAGLNARGGAHVKDSAPRFGRQQVGNKLRGFILNDYPPLPESMGRLHIP